ncbi:MAG: nucleotidyltransferase family protein [Pseudomonadota bacterium]
MTARIEIPKTKLRQFCRRNKIRRLSLFGSVLRDDFSSESDIDILVEFAPNAGIGLIKLAGLEIELSQLLGRKAEIHTVKGLNPRFKNEVLKLAETQYEQA